MDVMTPYIKLGRQLLDKGFRTNDRTNVGTRSIFSEHLKLDVSMYSPFLTQRKIPLRSVIGELLWFIEGSVDVDVLSDDYRCNFWNEWSSDVTRTIGPMYGKQWRDCNGVDQLAVLLKTAIATPTSRRMLVDVWNPEVIPGDVAPPKFNPKNGLMALAPCHFSYQLKIYPISDKIYDVSLQFNQRSSDYFLGLPNNIASYYVLLRMICAYLTKKTDIKHRPSTLSVSLGDVHIYNNHIEECEELVSRDESELQPRFDLSAEASDILESYMDGRFAAVQDKHKQRRENLNLLYNSISQYHPGKAIKGARNV